MPSKVKYEESPELEAIQDELVKLSSLSVVVGPVGREGSSIVKIAGANEFGATILPKRGKYLAVPLVPEAKGKSPRDFVGLQFIKGNGNPVLARVEGESVFPVFVLMKKVVIPERSFLRSTADSKKVQNKMKKFASAMIVRLLQGNASANDVATAIGESLSASVKSTIASGVSPGNAPLTIALKGSGKGTLVDEARLLKSISYEVVHE